MVILSKYDSLFTSSGQNKLSSGPAQRKSRNSYQSAPENLPDIILLLVGGGADG